MSADTARSYCGGFGDDLVEADAVRRGVDQLASGTMAASWASQVGYQ